MEAHVRRGDLFWNWVVVLVQAIHWFNPLVWFAGRAFRAEREYACDRSAVADLSLTTFTAAIADEPAVVSPEAQAAPEDGEGAPKAGPKERLSLEEFSEFLKVRNTLGGRG